MTPTRDQCNSGAHLFLHLIDKSVNYAVNSFIRITTKHTHDEHAIKICAYTFRSLLDSSARVSFGSDWSVAPAAPIEGIYAAFTRRALDDANPGGWIPERKITVEEALHAYTTTAAYASFDENLKGMLKPGMLADFVLLAIKRHRN